MNYSAFLVVPFYLIAIYLGLLGHAKYPELANGDMLVYVEMAELLPHGLLGLGVAAVLSVVLSSANTLILVVGAAVLRDILGKKAGVDQSLLPSRLVNAASGVIAATLALVVPSIVQLLLNAFYMLLVLGPALIGVFHWKRANRSAATWSIAVGALCTTATLLVAPGIAFLPGVLFSAITFVIISYLRPHATTEEPSLYVQLTSNER